MQFHAHKMCMKLVLCSFAYRAGFFPTLNTIEILSQSACIEHFEKHPKSTLRDPVPKDSFFKIKPSIKSEKFQYYD
jgi:hypothetical protein